MMSRLADVRSAFLDYFAKQGHVLRGSASLVPENDSTLLFVNAGMVPFKKYFTDDFKQVKGFASVQKCLRVGGKHNDLENVGHTRRHHTFFEMLGNFSFGGYFKEEAIEMAWNFLSKTLQIDCERLWITVHSSDAISGELWKKITSLPSDRILTVATEDNFWSMGERGPCGPCSEIYYDLGSHLSGTIHKNKAPEGDRYLEIWNLVFTQYDRQSDGELLPLPRSCIDTGMGLERITAVLEDLDDNYSLPEFQQLMSVYQEFLSSEDSHLACRVMADHLRSIAFLMADGVHPSREGRGYVLRRIIRRAVRYGHKAGSCGPILTEPLTELLATMGGYYPQLLNAEPMIRKIVIEEEQRFLETLERGLKILQEETSTMTQGEALSGDSLFRLYDTYGFPVDLTQDLLHEQSLLADMDGFEQCMKEQKIRGQRSWKSLQPLNNKNFLRAISPTLFKGFETLSCEGNVLSIIAHQESHEHLTLKGGQSCHVIFDKTPFYAESGGQVADQGFVTLPSGEEMFVEDVQKKDDLFLHDILCPKTNASVTFRRGDCVQLLVSSQRRLRLRANHSATHLLHEALRHILGKHVVQRGSLVTEHALRFDFSHSAPVSVEEKERIERRINEMIVANNPSETRVMTKKEALSSGAVYMMGENYGDTVRVVFLGGEDKKASPCSVEFCGGTHVERTGDIGFFMITKEQGISSGVRRIEALTNRDALALTQKRRHLLREASALLKIDQESFPERLRELLNKLKKQQKELEGLKRATPAGSLKKERCGSYDLAMGQFDHLTIKELRQNVSIYKKDHKGVIVLFAKTKQQIFVVISVPDAFSTSWNAKTLLDEINPILDARGGGSATLAQAGGNHPDALQKAQEKLRKMIKMIKQS